MKVVLFCGGYGMRMRDGTSDLPKPMHPVGPRPLIWHVMRYYAHFGHRDFVLCLGYGAHHIKNYFLNYDETESNDFTLNQGEVTLLGGDIQDWNITFVHTGLESPIGERLRRVKALVKDDEMFHANYADVLTDAPLDKMVAQFAGTDAVGQLMAVPPQSAFHCVDVSSDGRLESITTLQEMPLLENGGYLMFRPEIFDHLEPNCDLIGDACAPLARKGRMSAYQHRGFWQPADTIKERNALEAAYQGGTRPWMLWEEPDRDPLQAAIAEMQRDQPSR
ncbi:glucose-1-phosphate cytidylyltransferase [Pseudonocardia sediminis]|uniref:Glucose-1-phosphate cytidylyltransferase n=1 Tax=Pseudonocardia sediminis TaxID=1397368 RepID=A0A4Q7USV4_PSEST|nr:sugar phosphate nucleotidyltransferase [Pseudonocardia sediminis]RZT83918.1 glucose-1-phosphate cytidylyltransferase [Pseudonocardia sediminis]